MNVEQSAICNQRLAIINQRQPLTKMLLMECKSFTATRIRTWVSHLQERHANHYTTAAYNTQYLPHFSGTQYGASYWPHYLPFANPQQVSRQSHCALTNSPTHIYNRAEIACKSLTATRIRTEGLAIQAC